MTIRFATPSDAPALLAVYAPYITDSVISFEYEVPSVEEFAGRVEAVYRQLPYLLAERDGQVLGFAYASRHAERMAYQWSVNTSVYLHADAHRQGIARSLYTRLFDCLIRQGYCNAFAGITLPNEKSEGFHRAMGFGLIGTYSNTGYKFGQWHSVAWYQRILQPYPDHPQPPIPITGLA
ncbi:GNAT family N-acetyltransferase [Larkinella soli]|uniref:GNAT family N-acetyltransferase n=1 Tax=Larkinella soli TaxID=1770527 RepID=UPI000FFC634D|nr:GNAT family N-acetyltransferase [Larkinella soli]